MSSRVTVLRDTIAAAIEIKKDQSGFCENNFDVSTLWYPLTNYEQMFDSDLCEKGLVWLCARPTDVINEVRSSSQVSAATENLRLILAIAYPGSTTDDAVTAKHVELTEEIVDTIRKITLANSVFFVSAEAMRDDSGTPFLYVNMQRGNFFTLMNLTFSHVIN